MTSAAAAFVITASTLGAVAATTAATADLAVPAVDGAVAQAALVAPVAPVAPVAQAPAQAPETSVAPVTPVTETQAAPAAAPASSSPQQPVQQKVVAKPVAAAKPAAPKFVKPAQGRLTSQYGPRAGGFHYGIDIANAVGTPEYSVAAGTVINAGPASGFGLWVRVRHDDGTITVYGHMQTILVKNGQRVQAGTQIATMGSRGQSSGPHLHFEVVQGGKKINPLPWLAQRGITV